MAYQTQLESQPTKHEILILGDRPYFVDDPEETWATVMGRLTEKHWDMGFGNAMWMECRRCEHTSFCHDQGWFGCRACGDSDGDHHVGSVDWERLDLLWKEAGNVTQWKGRRFGHRIDG
jgi:hypothetical protein